MTRTRCASCASLIVVPGFEPKTFLAAIQDHRVATAFVVPPIANFLASHPLVDKFDLSSLETVGCGAAPLGSATEDRFPTAGVAYLLRL